MFFIKESKLIAKWSKEKEDIVIQYPIGKQTYTDMAYLFREVFTEEFRKEMECRGYDIKTLIFSIDVDTKNKKFEEKFPTIAKEIKE